MISATNEMIKQTHVQHEKQIQRLEKEIKKKDEMNLIMHHVLLKILWAFWNIADVPNNKFDEILFIIASLVHQLKAQDPTTKAYNSLSNQMNTSFFKRYLIGSPKSKIQPDLPRKLGYPTQEGEKDQEEGVVPFLGSLPRSSISEMNLTIMKLRFFPHVPH